jgi:arylsulfatase A
MNVDINIELGNLPEPQLYDLRKDPSEQQNLASKYPEQLKRLMELLEKVKQSK